MKQQVLFAVAGCCLLASSAEAAEAILLKPKAQRVTELTLPDTAAGLPPAGNVFVAKPLPKTEYWLVTFEMEVVWDDKAENLEYGEQRFRLHGKEGEADFFTRVNALGITEYGGPQVNFYRPFDYKEKKVSRHGFRWLWMVPEGSQELTLELAKLSAKVTPENDPISLDISKMVTAKILSTKVVAELPIKHDFGDDEKLSRTITNPGGSLLEVKIQFASPVKTKPGESISLGIEGLAIRFKGWRALPARVQNDQGFSDSSVYLGNAENPPEPLVLYYAVPSNLKSFELTLGGAVLAKGEVKE